MLFHWGDINHLGTLDFPVVENIQLFFFFYKDFEWVSDSEIQLTLVTFEDASNPALLIELVKYCYFDLELH